MSSNSVWFIYLECLQQPFVIFGLTLAAASFWVTLEKAVVIALITSVLIKLAFEILIITSDSYYGNNREHFCAMHSNRWCPEKDVCYQDVSKEEATVKFLNDTDLFIKQLYDFAQPDDPAYAISHHKRDNL